MVDTPVKIEVTSKPKHTNYYFYNSSAILGVERTLAFDATGLEVKGTYQDGRTEVLDNSKLTFSTVPAKAGEHKVVITANGGKTAEPTALTRSGQYSQTTSRFRLAQLASSTSPTTHLVQTTGTTTW